MLRLGIKHLFNFQNDARLIFQRASSRVGTHPPREHFYPRTFAPRKWRVASPPFPMYAGKMERQTHAVFIPKSPRQITPPLPKNLPPQKKFKKTIDTSLNPVKYANVVKEN